MPVLASTLGNARAGYRRYRDEAVQSTDAVCTPAPAPDAGEQARQRTDQALDRIVGAICTAGRQRFEGTASLMQRFAVPGRRPLASPE